MLDPTLARTYVGRIVFAGLCDKLFDITPDLKIVPQLATEYKWSDDNKALTLKLRPGVKFQDGEKLDAAAVKYTIERHLKMPGSYRKGEISRRHLGRDDRRSDRQAQPLGALRAASRAAHRSRRHDRVAEGGGGARRQVRHQAGLRRSLQIRRARGAGPHRAREIRRLLGQGQRQDRQGGLPADPGLDGAPRQSALRPARLRRAHRRDRRRRRPAGKQAEARLDRRARL